MRVYPYTVPRLMGLASIGHTTVEDILLNNVPEDEPEVAEAFVYGDATPPTVCPARVAFASCSILMRGVL